MAMTNRYWRTLSNIWKATRRSREISVTFPETLLYYIGLRLPVVRQRQFRFQWKKQIFWARPVDANAVEEILLNHEYAFAARIMAQTESSMSPTVIDCGANIGLFSLAMLAAQPNAIVHSLEPGARTFQILKHNAGTNPAPRWHVYALALWKIPGPLRFGATVASTSSRIYDLAPEGEVEVVQAITLSEFTAQYTPREITLLKLDIEGAEEAVLVESESVLERVANLVIEIHPPRSDEERVVDILRAHFPYLHRVPGRRSAKPLMLASRTHADFPQ
jgi:FkbM family methyltransferase